MSLDEQSDVILDNRTPLEKLRDLRQTINFDNEKERFILVEKINSTISELNGEPFLLEEVQLQPEEMNSLLLEAVKHVAVKNNDKSESAHGFIDFVADSGYEYKPADVVEAGEPPPRVTPILYLARKDYDTGFPLPANVRTTVIKLFKIYKDFNVNYTDEDGLTHFHAACMARCERVVERFLELGQDPNVRVDDTGDTPLILVITDRSLVELLLRRGADPNLANKLGLTPLHCLSAIEEDDDDRLNALFELSHEKYRPVQVNARNKHGDVPLLYSLKRGRKKLTEILLRRGADPNLSNQNGMTPLHCICTYSEDVDFLRMYYDINEKLHQTLHTNAKDNHGRTPLWLAAFRGMRHIIKFLLTAGADPSLACEDAKTPLHVVCANYRDDPSLANILLELSQQRFKPLQVNPQTKLGNTPLHLAMEFGNKKLVEVLLRHGARPNITNKMRRTPLHKLLNRQDCDNELLKLFFEINEAKKQPVRIDGRDLAGKTPLHLAMTNGNRYAIDLLTRKSADASSAQENESTTVSSRIRKSTEDDDDDDDQNNLAPARKLRRLDPNLANANGTTLLHVYCKNSCYQQLVELLPKQLLDINAQDEYGNTPLHWALFGKYNQLLIELLLRSGANRNAANVQGQRPLHYISKRTDNEIRDIHDLMEVFFEIDGEVEVDARDNKGLTPLQLAVANVRPDMVDILLDHGADLSKFVFPAAKYFAGRFKKCQHNFGLELVSGALACVERLEERGYETRRSDALTIMGLFKKYKLFAKPGDLHESFKEKKFKFVTEKLRINSEMSLDKLIKAQPSREPKELPSYTELFKFWRGSKSRYDVITARVCENMSRKFFWRWAMHTLLKEMPIRTSLSMPEEVCVIILEPLKNKELYKVCLQFRN
ncbi:ankyrin-1-like [Trichogramma pretiosum]|uniref:ankyrin-1-like n=1 Tax=Trichogramma pretiosum TaxID=7493 RepID=UPI000C719966|nr:ankyrin-1-like [Trichogramma pretiosum]